MDFSFRTIGQDVTEDREFGKDCGSDICENSKMASPLYKSDESELKSEIEAPLPEDPEPEDPDLEDPDPEDLDPEDPDPGDPDPGDPDPEARHRPWIPQNQVVNLPNQARTPLTSVFTTEIHTKTSP